MATRAMVKKSGGPSGGAAHIHLVRDGSEASLCGLPRESLGPLGTMDELMCEPCLAASSAANRARPSRVKLPPEYKRPRSL